MLMVFYFGKPAFRQNLANFFRVHPRQRADHACESDFCLDSADQRLINGTDITERNITRRSDLPLSQDQHFGRSDLIFRIDLLRAKVSTDVCFRCKIPDAVIFH